MTTTESYTSSLLPPFTSSISKTFVDAIDLRQRCKLYLFVCSHLHRYTIACRWTSYNAIFMLRHITAKMLKPTVRQLLYRQLYDYCTDDADDANDILSQSSTSPGPPSDILLQGSPATAMSMVDTTMVTSHSHTCLWCQWYCILFLLHRHTGLWAPIWHPVVLIHHPTTAMRTAATVTIATVGEVIHHHSGLWAPVYLLMMMSTMS